MTRPGNSMHLNAVALERAVDSLVTPRGGTRGAHWSCRCLEPPTSRQLWCSCGFQEIADHKRVDMLAAAWHRPTASQTRLPIMRVSIRWHQHGTDWWRNRQRRAVQPIFSDGLRRIGAAWSRTRLASDPGQAGSRSVASGAPLDLLLELFSG